MSVGSIGKALTFTDVTVISDKGGIGQAMEAAAKAGMALYSRKAAETPNVVKDKLKPPDKNPNDVYVPAELKP